MKILKRYQVILWCMLMPTLISSSQIAESDGSGHYQAEPQQPLVATDDNVLLQSDISNTLNTEIFMDYDTALQTLIDEEAELKIQLDFPEYTMTNFESQSETSGGNLHISLVVDYYEAYEELRNLKWLSKLSKSQNQALSSLEVLAENGDHRASFLLADINMYGNFSLPMNATKALKYYELTAELSGSPDAHYMTGFIYASGLFGKVPMDQGKALLHYELAAEGSNIKAAMCLGYRYLKGISVPQNLELSFYYYGMVTQVAYQQLMDGPIGGNNLDYCSVRIPDLLDGMYGLSASETRSTFTKQNQINSDQLFDEFLDNDAVYPYFHGLLRATQNAYRGDLNQPRDYDLAFTTAFQCATEGVELAAVKKVLKNNNVDKNTLPGYMHKIGACCGYLGHMYLRGEGVEANLEEAEKWITTAAKLSSESAIYVDLGLLYEVYKHDRNQSLSFYEKSSSVLGKFHMARSMLEDTTSPPTEAVGTLLTEASRRRHVGAMYYFTREYEKGFIKCTENFASMVYKIGAEELEPYVSSLSWAFSQLVKGNNDLALIGYAMAAEQGFEVAQSSAAYMLYSPVGYLDLPPNVPLDRFLSAVNYYKRSADQGNVDSAVFLGDMFYKGLSNQSYDPNDDEKYKYIMEPDLEKAATLYHSAVDMQSKQASFNLGYMYEMGLGVKRDFHLAKRYYDAALLGNTKASIPIQISLLRLHIKTWWYGLWGMEVTGISSQNETKERRTFSDWISMFHVIREREIATAEQYEYQMLQQQQHQQVQQQTKVAYTEANAADEFSPQFADDDFYSDITLVAIVFGIISFALFNRWRANRNRRRAQGEGENHDNNENDRPNVNGQDGVWRFGNFQIQFAVIPL
ncbi:hypothetical protein CANARDRAFT_10274 [[Candida] arabinofermentans NRRL YB-2248]|uniref:ERAD-associated E3 ubiquitin-protein ligase component HRD3 n=1 Tax=[Candida] arabinofermentans NRRL YB-2248 TaxID=983967 RepID=A0A1E4STA1_9ASCO|nr:hypothetical protein CANARDRAFT_10274 [[Candida] arabinofermentans NRRL YB-2248]